MSPVLHAFAFIFLTCFSIRVDTYPNGQVTDACSSMMPSHNGTLAQTSASPYILNVANTTYSPGEKITVTLTSSNGSIQFKGFLIQARSGNDATPLGSFQTTSDSQTLNCTSADSAVSHVNGSEKTSIQMTWVAPTSTTASIEIRATVVQSEKVFWTNVVSSNLSYLAVPSNTASSTTSTTILSNSTLGPNVNVNDGTSVTTTSVNEQPTSGSPLPSAVSQMSDNGKTSIQMTWVAPTSTTASNEIRATVVQSKTVFWTNVVSSKLSYLAVPSNTASSTTSTTTSSKSTLGQIVNVNNGTSVTTTSINKQPTSGSPLPSAVSQTSNGKTSIQMTWVAPTSTTASNEIRATVVQSKTVFWANVVSSKLSYLAVPSNTASSTTSTTTSSSFTLGPNVNVNNGTSVTTTSVNKQPTSGSPLPAQNFQAILLSGVVAAIYFMKQ